MKQDIKVEKFYQDHVWVIQAFSLEPSSVDGWEKAVRDYLVHMNGPQRYLVYDLTPIARPGVTIYMNRRVTALAYDNRDACGRVGIALNLNPTVRYVFEPFIRFTSVQLQPRLDARLFSLRDEAMSWVVDSLPAEIRAAGA